MNLSSLLVKMDPISANPIKEWSVNTVRKPMVRACKIPSQHKVLKLACPWTIWICSRMIIFRKIGKNEKTVGIDDSR